MKNLTPNEVTNQIAAINSTLVSTTAKAVDALTASAAALRSITECESELDTQDKRIAQVVERLRTIDDSIKLLIQARNDQTIRLGECESNWRQHAKVSMERQKDYRNEWDTLNRQIARVATDLADYIDRSTKRRNGHEQRNANFETRISSLEEELRGTEASRKARMERWLDTPPAPKGAITRSHMYVILVMFDGGTVAGKSGFASHDAAIRWFDGYVKRCREAFAHDPKRYTYIVLSESN